MGKVRSVEKKLPAILEAIKQLRCTLALLDELDLDEPAARVDMALDTLEPSHPDVMAGLHGPRPFPERLNKLLVEPSRDRPR